MLWIILPEPPIAKNAVFYAAGRSWLVGNLIAHVECTHHNLKYYRTDTFANNRIYNSHIVSFTANSPVFNFDFNDVPFEPRPNVGSFTYEVFDPISGQYSNEATVTIYRCSEREQRWIYE